MADEKPFAARFISLELRNFLSHRSSTVHFGDFTALIGLNASGKSNVVTAMKLLREIPLHGLPNAIARRGGFDQLRHRSEGRPNDPALRLNFVMVGETEESSYEIRFRSVRGRKYEVKLEQARVTFEGRLSTFESDGSEVSSADTDYVENRPTPIPRGQSAISASGSFAAFVVYHVLSSIQTVEVQPPKIRELQEPSSLGRFEPDGSNAATIYDELSPTARTQLVKQLATVVPGIERIDVQSQTDRVTLTFVQSGRGKRREFSARQMSDGTLRVFGILTALHQRERPQMLLIEEPEVAIHLGALRTLVELLRQQAVVGQIAITTHSSDIVDALEVDMLRIVTNDGTQSSVSTVASHTRKLILEQLATPGELLRLDALDPA